MSATARQAADAYIEAINAGRYSDVGNLFAEDAILLSPEGRTITGRPAIAAFFSNHFENVRPAVRGCEHLEAGPRCVMEIETQNPATGEFEVTAIDYFTINNDGKLLRMDVFLRGSPDAFQRFAGRYGDAG